MRLVLVLFLVQKCTVRGFQVVSTTERSVNSVGDNIKTFLENQLKVCLTLNGGLRENQNAYNQNILAKVDILHSHGGQLQKQISDFKAQIDERMDTQDLTLSHNTNKLDEILKLLTVVVSGQATAINETQSQLKDQDQKLKDIQKMFERLEQKEEQIPRNCKEVQKQGNDSGIYQIKPKLATEPFMVLCDMKTHDGGWTYVLNRFDGSQDFYLGWEDYKRGFGNLTGEFWLGLENLYQLTNDGPNELLFELVDWDNKKEYALYDAFQISNEEEGYAITSIGHNSGDAEDSFTYHFRMKFTTKDKDQDNYSKNCAMLWKGGWWYKSCSMGALTEEYTHTKLLQSKMFWGGTRSQIYGLKQARMMVRQK